jgi:hypothetical protein
MLFNDEEFKRPRIIGVFGGVVSYIRICNTSDNEAIYQNQGFIFAISFFLNKFTVVVNGEMMDKIIELVMNLGI